MDADLFVRTFPRLFHMAHHESLASIRKHGLLSTSSLLDLFEIKGARRNTIERSMRPKSVIIEHAIHGTAVIRDQKPIMNDLRLEKALGGSCTASEFHKLLNSMVFFWVHPSRLDTLRNAVEYRVEPQLILTLDTRKLVDAYYDKIILCPMNSGSCKPMAHARTPKIFERLSNYDFDFWRKRKGSAQKAVVECTVEDGVLDVDRFLIKTQIVG